jgi:TonB-dependent receptor
VKNTNKTAIAIGVAQLVLMASGAAFAQSETTTVVVHGQRGALESAQNIKKNSDEIVDSVVADDIGKLPDKSVTEVLQRVVGVTIDRTLNRVDPQQGVGDGIAHFAAEGTAVSIRGLGAGQVRSEFNGRDAFSANGGRALSFEDVPPELMAGVDVYKNPSAEQIEGGIGGLVNLRTALPFDSKGRKFAFSTDVSGSSLRKKTSPPSLSGLYSDRWDTRFGQVGVLIDLAHSKIETQSDSLSISPYISRDDLVAGDSTRRWITAGAGWGQNTFERTRDGLYGAVQWKKGNLMSYLTFLRSKYKMHTGENSYFGGTNPATVSLDPGATFDDRGALLTGTLHDTTNGGPGFGTGLGFGTDARSSGRDSDTRDLSWSGTWRASDAWTFKADLQHVQAKTAGYDNTVGLGGWVPGQAVDLRGGLPTFSFDQASRAYLADPDHYYWGFTQVHRDVATAKMNTARLDAKYTFDNPVLNDLRFGLRVTERSALTQSTHDSEWSQISQGWAVGPNSWQPLTQFAALSDPRFSGNVNLHQFSNFFGGTVAAPAPVIVPDAALADSVDAIAKLHTYYTTLCNEANATGRTNDCSWKLPPFGDATGLNEQHERTQAAYAQLRFAFDKAPYPIDGTLGVRVVRTNPKSIGYTLFDPPKKPLLPGVPDIPASSQKQTFENAYTRVLPSLNLRLKASDELQFRFALSRGMSRPDFYQLQAYTTLSMDVKTHTPPGDNQQPVVDSISYNGSLRGNTSLKPAMSTNVDLTAEYYFGRASSATLGVFNKRIKDLIISQTTVYPLQDVDGKSYDFMVSGPVNGLDARVSGIEAGFQTYFDKLPGLFSGLGVSSNFTYIDSTTTYHDPVDGLWCTPKDTLSANTIRNLQGCDTDGKVFGNMPMSGLSKTSYNVALLYDKDALSMRLAYSWRDKYLQSTNAYGTAGGDGIDRNPASPNVGQQYSVNYGLPTWGGAYGQLDFGFQYKLTDNLRLGGQVGNLTNQVYKQYMQQGIGMKLRSAFYTGRSFGAQLNYTF